MFRRVLVVPLLAISLTACGSSEDLVATGSSAVAGASVLISKAGGL